MAKIIYKKESYEIIGCCYEVFNTLGPGLRESTYQKALAEILKQKQKNFKSQVRVSLKINNKVFDTYILDFLIDNAIAVELKVGDHFFRRDIEQIFSYLKSMKLKLGLLINFTSKGVRFKRIINLNK
ncbi:MAG: hypothetical protein COX39_02960 [Candidatus Nealsonbacteria bacterium CG23_combo_of_CG06-09_8_20_14_all_40_13]|uniref:GxxExxY protein n=1 Tax=Candidatus Nealsonbacteria bacterium CG23_combo_of_CG06-09_8_20_14_all_40_13 TaxID=1974724 RepID=A0A2G9YQI8_9BACT|nr:MAG: hypothetical protein COX39_02960 [Candidatus Nealsonbacteria bacterium CG23_combo_of_CG06-09_8_20_14_all_40_13]PIR70875.1 MAG: hypothetical protein COU44_02670 [Candidatus Nealsonbacteria bacterium CG10_big_fil_rev_8_21_14_0_10_40_24]PIU43132.1 MAG: hypothetical protein COS97_02655 [Candidatus Nealsonbacteria bacterium CG07_land_8_20_14_0_80_40_10]